MEYNPEQIAREVEQKELGEQINEMTNTELIEFIIDSGVCNALAKQILKQRNIETNE